LPLKLKGKSQLEINTPKSSTHMYVSLKHCYCVYGVLLSFVCML